MQCRRQRHHGLIKQKTWFVMVHRSVTVLLSHFQEVMHTFRFCFRTCKMEITMRRGVEEVCRDEESNPKICFQLRKIFQGSHVSNESSSPNFDTSLLFHPTSRYFCLLSIFYLEENQKKSGFPFGWINNFLIQICLSLSRTYIAKFYIPNV